MNDRDLAVYEYSMKLIEQDRELQKLPIHELIMKAIQFSSCEGLIAREAHRLILENERLSRELIEAQQALEVLQKIDFAENG